MGYGDEIIGSSLARGAKKRGKRIAFGDGNRIKHHSFATQIYKNNPNIAFPGSENDKDIEWIEHYSGKRIYCRQFGRRWLFVSGKVKQSGEIFFDDEELAYADKFGNGFVVIEPNVPKFKSVAVNKTWPKVRYLEVADRLIKAGYEVAQFVPPSPYKPDIVIPGARQILTPSFRHALSVLSCASCFIGSEGGLHHGAAAVSIPAVVIFGGFISPAITGYSCHTNLFTGDKPCGSLDNCAHCKKALEAISTDQVFEETVKIMTRHG